MNHSFIAGEAALNKLNNIAQPFAYYAGNDYANGVFLKK